MLVDLRLDSRVVNSLYLERLYNLLQPSAIKDVVVCLVSAALIVDELLDLRPMLSLLLRLIDIVHA